MHEAPFHAIVFRSPEDLKAELFAYKVEKQTWHREI